MYFYQLSPHRSGDTSSKDRRRLSAAPHQPAPDTATRQRPTRTGAVYALNCLIPFARREIGISNCRWEVCGKLLCLGFVVESWLWYVLCAQLR